MSKSTVSGRLAALGLAAALAGCASGKPEKVAKTDTEIETQEEKEARLQSMVTEHQAKEFPSLKEEEEDEAPALHSDLQAEAVAVTSLARLRTVADVRETDRGLVVTLKGGDVFAGGSADLRPKAKEPLTLVAEFIKQHPNRSVAVEGHTDSEGEEGRNLELSWDRATGVMAYLVDHGVPPEQIRAEARGEYHPIASNDTPEGRAQNRRVEIVLETAERGAFPAQPMKPAKPFTGGEPDEGEEEGEEGEKPAPEKPGKPKTPEKKGEEPPPEEPEEEDQPTPYPFPKVEPK